MTCLRKPDEVGINLRIQLSGRLCIAADRAGQLVRDAPLSLHLLQSQLSSGRFSRADQVVHNNFSETPPALTLQAEGRSASWGGLAAYPRDREQVRSAVDSQHQREALCQLEGEPADGAVDHQRCRRSVFTCSNPGAHRLSQPFCRALNPRAHATAAFDRLRAEESQAESHGVGACQTIL